MTKSAPSGGADSTVHDLFFRTDSDGGWLNRSIGLIVPPPIPVGGASYAVTHSRRKYHHPRMCLMASALPGAVCGAGGVRSFPPGVVSPFPGENIPAHPPPGFTHTECIWSPYSVVFPGISSVSGSSRIFCPAGFTCPLTGSNAVQNTQWP